MFVTCVAVLAPEQSLMGFVTPGNMGASAVKTGASKVLLPYMVPSVVLSVDFIPTTLSGKADWRALLCLLVDSKAAHGNSGIKSSHGQYVAPNSPLEEVILTIYRKGPQDEGIGMDSDFIGNGGDFLKAVCIVASLRTLHEEHTELQTGRGFLSLSAMNILQYHTPGALLKSCIGSSLGIKGELWWPRKLRKMCLRLYQRLYWSLKAQE